MRPVVIWDWNGTLLDDVAACVAAINELLTARSLPPVTIERHATLFTFPVRTYYEHLGFKLDTESFADIALEYHSAYDRAFGTAALRPEAHATLTALADRGIQQYVLSASEESRLNEQLAEAGILGFLSGTAGLGDLQARSKVERGRRLLEQEAIEPTSAVLIGDTVHDHDVATALGAQSVLVTGGHQSRQALSATGAPVVATLGAAVDLALQGSQI